MIISGASASSHVKRNHQKRNFSSGPISWNSCSNDFELKKYCTDPIPEISTLFSNSPFPDDHGRRFPPLKQRPPRSLDYRPHSPFFPQNPMPPRTTATAMAKKSTTPHHQCSQDPQYSFPPKILPGSLVLHHSSLRPLLPPVHQNPNLRKILSFTKTLNH